MFTQDSLEQDRAMLERWLQRRRELHGDSEFKSSTESGIELKPIYTPADIKGTEYTDIGVPGEYPFTRGHSPLQYQVEPWMMRILYAFGAGEDTRRRRDFLESLGMSQCIGTDRLAPFTILVPKVGEEAIARVREFRAKRDNGKTIQALSNVRVAAQRLANDWPSSCGSLMPSVIDAFRADATLGEVQRVLKEVLGYGYTT